MSRICSLTLVVSLALVPSACSVTDDADGARDEPTLSATWAEADDDPFPGTLVGEVVLPPTEDVVLDIGLRNARFTSLPTECLASTIVRPRTRITADNSRLRCEVAGAAEERVVGFRAVAAGAPGAVAGGTVSTNFADLEKVELPDLEVPDTAGSLQPRLRLISSPDFLNGDVGDLARGPGSWDPTRSSNGINDDYRAALDAILGDWSAIDPDGVLVAGDLIEGHWGADPQRTGTFGPVTTPAERVAALRRAADTYYPQWIERFEKHGLAVFPAVGDHEYGDNPWPGAKRALAPAFRERFAHYFTRTASGELRYPDHPRGEHAATAYAGRPLPDVQLISIDPFDIDVDRARIGLDHHQRTWLRGVLQRAERDGVRWTIVQGHVPILGPVRTRGSSQLQMPGGASSWIWRMFEKYGVDLYLAGEAHDVTVLEHGGVTQVVHGGLFPFGLTNALTIDFYDEFVYLTLRDYVVRDRESKDGSRLWETRPNGMPAHIEVLKEPFTLGTGVLPDEGGLEDGNGLLELGPPLPSEVR